jgi:CheY-like chemotaxis protein
MDLRLRPFHPDNSSSITVSGQGLQALVLDTHLEDMSGIALTPRLVDLGLAFPVIFITADDEQRIRSGALAPGCVAFLRKPCEPAELLSALQLGLKW